VQVALDVLSTIVKLDEVDEMDPNYVSLGATRVLLFNGLASPNARLAAPDMVSTEEGADLAQTSRVTMKAWIAKGRCIGLPTTENEKGIAKPPTVELGAAAATPIAHASGAAR